MKMTEHIEKLKSEIPKGLKSGKTMNCEKCLNPTVKISAGDFTDYICGKCKHKKRVYNKKDPPAQNLKIKLGKTASESKIMIGDKEIKNCETLQISADANKDTVKAYLGITHFPTDVELTDWETSFRLIGTRDEQINCLEAVLKKLKNENTKTEKKDGGNKNTQ